MSRLATWWKDWRRHRRSPIEEISHLTDQFYTTLEAEVAKIEAASPGGGPPGLAEIREMLKAKEKSWANAYRIEQLLVHLYDDPTMELELRRRLQESRDVLGPPLTTWYKGQAEEAQEAPVRRVLLGRLVNDLQWRYMVNEVKRGYSKAVTRSSGWIFITTLVAFLLWALLPYLLERMAGILPSATHQRPWYLLLLAGSAGAWGASFSMLIGLRKRLEESNVNDLKLMRSLAMLVTRPLIGLGAAFILYYFLVAGLLSGSLFPNFAETTPAGEVKKNLALLVVLSFLAGFSEKLVPGLLARTGERFSEPRTEAEAANRAHPPSPPGPAPASGQPGGPNAREVPGDSAAGQGRRGAEAADPGGQPAPPPASG